MHPPPARVPSREITNVRPSYQPRSINRASSKVSAKNTPADFVLDSAATSLMFAVESKTTAQNAVVRVIRRLRVDLRLFMISLAYSQKWCPSVARRQTGCDPRKWEAAPRLMVREAVDQPGSPPGSLRVVFLQSPAVGLGHVDVAVGVDADGMRHRN